MPDIIPDGTFVYVDNGGQDLYSGWGFIADHYSEPVLYAVDHVGFSEDEGAIVLDTSCAISPTRIHVIDKPVDPEPPLKNGYYVMEGDTSVFCRSSTFETAHWSQYTGDKTFRWRQADDIKDSVMREAGYLYLGELNRNMNWNN
jgi:hypothetical protein